MLSRWTNDLRFSPANITRQSRTALAIEFWVRLGFPSAPLLGVPSCRIADTNVVFIANWAPPNSGSPSATISSLRAPRRSTTPRSRSLTSTFTITLAPASRRVRAAALSTANPRRPNTPQTAHADLCWPNASRKKPHRQARTVKSGSNRVNLLVGKHTKGTAANGPACDRNRAWSLRAWVDDLQLPVVKGVACHPLPPVLGLTGFLILRRRV